MRNMTITEDEINLEFRSIISHALLGSDTSDIDKETWELLLDGCTKFAMSLMSTIKINKQAPYEIEIVRLQEEVERLKGLLETYFKSSLAPYFFAIYNNDKYKVVNELSENWEQFKKENQL